MPVSHRCVYKLTKFIFECPLTVSHEYKIDSLLLRYYIPDKINSNFINTLKNIKSAGVDKINKCYKKFPEN